MSVMNPQVDEFRWRSEAALSSSDPMPRHSGPQGMTRRKKMDLKGFGRATSVVAAVAAVGVGTGLAAPVSASAATQTAALATYTPPGERYEAQVDNNPGNGATSWMWLADYNWRDQTDAVAKVVFVDGTTAKYGPVGKGTLTGSLPKKVSHFQVCGFYTYITGCGSWVYL
ncbi:hypothetical protein [Streptomyces sp. NPDC057428]|uniref:hypothetical protein n=1 Tax=Streptomyces sp. NPDC057428 TaxID=3346129 RepID=UPI0036C26244